MKKTKKEVSTVNESVNTSKETEIVRKLEIIPSTTDLEKAGKILNDHNSKSNEASFHKVEVNPSKPIEATQKTLDEMRATIPKISFVSVKDIPENETIPIRVGQTYIALDKLDMQMIFEWVALKLVDIAKAKAKNDNSDQVRIHIKGIGDIIFGRNSLVGTVTNSNIFLPTVANDHNAHCSENDCKGCPYNKVCFPGNKVCSPGR